MNLILVDIVMLRITGDGDGCARTAEDVPPELGVRDDGSLFDGDVEEAQLVGPILQVEQQRSMSVDGDSFRLVGYIFYLKM